MNSSPSLPKTTAADRGWHEGTGRERTLRRDQRGAHAGSRLCAAGDFHNNDHCICAGNKSQPKASNTPSLAKPQTKAVTINEAGQVFLDAYPVTMDELRTRLSQLKAANPELPVVIKGDTVVQYGKVMEVLELLGQLDITQLGLVTQRLVK
jgi:hypothetical protein